MEKSDLISHSTSLLRELSGDQTLELKSLSHMSTSNLTLLHLALGAARSRMSPEAAATPAPAVAVPAKPKKKSTSRPDRWHDAVEECRGVLTEIEAQLDKLQSASEGLRAVQEEYEEWNENLSENLRSSPVGEKLEEVCGLSIEDLADGVKSAVEEASSVVDEAEGIDLPRGFGRD